MSIYICKRTGYAQITLARRQRALVHRLVALAFLDNPECKPQVNHKNGKRSDNRIQNLEWVTGSENILHAFHQLDRANLHEGKFSGEHPTSKAVIATNMATGAISVYESAMDAVRLGFDSGCISRCCAGLSRFHRGHTWMFASVETLTQKVAA
ncbi:HNH endonuclease [Pseudomonas syringae pv. papulans]|uniref:HNH endonuclease n=2 Tax=Pseudomonas syringae TaxID=317 RepID=A0AA43DWW5_PSESX|nr:HNH endonuclease [Pseudomonas syringae pv. papulans]MDH4623797.1 HNH endonuclease [Pseudomonas syringae pv. papulans]